MNNMKNIIRLKDVPSNTIEEAIIIFKDHVKVKKSSGVDKFKKNSDDENDLVVKEAELIISDYLKNTNQNDNKKDKKVKKLKVINLILTILLIISIIL